MAKKDNGFTMIELMIVIAVIGILAGIAYPNFSKALRIHRLSSGIQEFQSALMFAKLTAIRNSETVSIVFAPGVGDAGTYTVFTDTPLAGTNFGNGVHEPGEPVLKRASMPMGVDLHNINLAGSLNGGLSMEFNSMGFPNRAMNIFFTGQISANIAVDATTTYYKRVDIRAGGNMVIERSNDDVTYY